MEDACHFQGHRLAVRLTERIADVGNYPVGPKVATPPIQKLNCGAACSHARRSSAEIETLVEGEPGKARGPSNRGARTRGYPPSNYRFI